MTASASNGRPSLAAARRLGADALRRAGRSRLQTAISTGGARAAALDSRRPLHRVMLQAIRRALPVRFDSRAAGDLDATLELRIRDPSGGEPARFALVIAHGRCEVRPGPAPEAGAGATIGADDIVRLASGAIGWPELLSSGRLELSGDPYLALRFPNLFRLPARAR
jgi:hypothetical protein